MVEQQGIDRPVVAIPREVAEVIEDINEEMTAREAVALWDWVFAREEGRDEHEKH